LTRLSNIILRSSIAAMLCTGLATGTEAVDKRPKQDIVVVAHRGLAPGLPENTLHAFRHALELCVDFIEVDLRMTRDGVPVIIHDDTVDRTTDGQGEVETFTLAELKKLDGGIHSGPEFAGARIPTFEETLALVIPKGGKLLLDIKSSSDLDCEKVVRLVEQHNAVKDVIVGARSVEDVKLFRSLNPDIRILGFMASARDTKKFIEAGADIIRLWPRWIRLYPPLIDQVHQFGKPVWITAGSAGREELAELITLGVNGILTDLPDVLMVLLARSRAGHPNR
jgi:glycerophosphoryl diester phosphodiesterase